MLIVFYATSFEVVLGDRACYTKFLRCYDFFKPVFGVVVRGAVKMSKVINVDSVKDTIIKHF